MLEAAALDEPVDDPPSWAASDPSALVAAAASAKSGSAASRAARAPGAPPGEASGAAAAVPAPGRARAAEREARLTFMPPDHAHDRV